MVPAAVRGLAYSTLLQVLPVNAIPLHYSNLQAEMRDELERTRAIAEKLDALHQLALTEAAGLRVEVRHARFAELGGGMQSNM